MITLQIDYLIDSLPRLLYGLEYTIGLTVLSLALGTPLGILMALGRSYGNKFLFFPIYIYERVLRGIPLLVILFLIFLGPSQFGLNLNAFKAAILALGLRSAAYQAQIFRSAINSIPQGQMVAARSMGMSKLVAIRHVILPQILRLSIPGWSNEYTILLKDTSLAYAIGVAELMKEASDRIMNPNAPPNVILPMYLIVAIIYFIMVISANQVLGYLETKYKMSGFETEVER
ncbi:MAG: amino acid ABC transporter permease [Euryarchaeota archaeon]|nr:amino acid ABC transporter permease [Euryarchaeota archaeon]